MRDFSFNKGLADASPPEALIPRFEVGLGV